MSRSRRAASVDPQVLARLSAVLGAGGWLPPPDGSPPAEPAPPGPSPGELPSGGVPPAEPLVARSAALDEDPAVAGVPVGRGPDSRPGAPRRRGRHAAARQSAARGGHLPVPHLMAVDGYAEGSDAEGSDAEGSDAEGSDAEGLDAEGLDAEGLYAEDSYTEGPDAEGPYAEAPYADGPYMEGPYAEGRDRSRAVRHDGEPAPTDPFRAGPRPANWPRSDGETAERTGVRSGRSQDLSGSASRRPPLGPSGAGSIAVLAEVGPPGPVVSEAPAGRVSLPPGTVTPPAPEPLLERWRSARLDPGRRGVAALVLVALVAVALAAAVVLRARPQAVAAPSVVAPGVPVPGGVPGAGSTAGPGSAGVRAGAGARSPSPGAVPATPAAELVVAVAGKVLRPGLVRLPPGSRVDDALRAAGGPLPVTDLSTVNLARVLVDGEQVLVGVPQTLPAATPPSTSSGAPAGVAAGPVDLNAATVPQLDALPGIGPVLAQKIVDWRSEHGRFGSVDQLREVSGIGESKYAELAPKVRV